MKKIIVIFLWLAPALLCAQSSKNWLIKTGKLFDSEAAQFKSGMDILVKDGRIEDVISDASVTAAQRENYTLIDLSKYTVLPGLIDAHTHLLYREGNSGNGSNTSTLALLRHLAMDGDAYRALYGAARAKGYLEAGITSVQDLGNSGLYGDIALRKAIGDKLLPGPNISCAGPGLAAFGGQMPGLQEGDQHLVDGEYRIVSGVTDAIAAVREHVNQGVNVIKVYADNRPNRTLLSMEEMQAIVKEAHRYNIRVTAHATVDQSIRDAVLAGVDGIEHAYNISDSTLMMMAQRKVIMVPTDGDREGLIGLVMKNRKDTIGLGAALNRLRQKPVKRLQRALKFGVTVAYGSDDYAESKKPFGEPSKHTLVGYHEAGVPIPQVLQIATRNSAQQLNWGKWLGILKKDYLADIIAVDNSIETDIQAIMNIKFVMKGGVVYVNN